MDLSLSVEVKQVKKVNVTLHSNELLSLIDKVRNSLKDYLVTSSSIKEENLSVKLGTKVLWGIIMEEEKVRVIDFEMECFTDSNLVTDVNETEITELINSHFSVLTGLLKERGADCEVITIVKKFSLGEYVFGPSDKSTLHIEVVLKQVEEANTRTKFEILHKF